MRAQIHDLTFLTVAGSAGVPAFDQSSGVRFQFRGASVNLIKPISLAIIPTHVDRNDVAEGGEMRGEVLWMMLRKIILSLSSESLRLLLTRGIFQIAFRMGFLSRMMR